MFDINEVLPWLKIVLPWYVVFLRIYVIRFDALKIHIFSTYLDIYIMSNIH